MNQNQKIEVDFFKEFGVTLKELEIEGAARREKLRSDFDDMFFCVSNGIAWDFENNCKADAATKQTKG